MRVKILAGMAGENRHPGEVLDLPINEARELLRQERAELVREERIERTVRARGKGGNRERPVTP